MTSSPQELTYKSLADGLQLAVAAGDPICVGKVSDGTPIYTASSAPRELPRLRPRFASAWRNKQPFGEAWKQLADWERDERLRTVAAQHPLTVVIPTKMVDVAPYSSGLYRPPRYPRQLPGRARWPEGEHRLQESSLLIVERPGTAVSLDYLLAAEEEIEIGPTVEIEIDPNGKAQEVEDQSVELPSIDPEPAYKIRFLDPTGNRNAEAGATRLLNDAGFTSVGDPHSDTTRGQGVGRLSECVRRARIHAEDLGTDLLTLREYYRTSPGKPDPLIDRRRAVAICLRLEGFSTSEIAKTLARTEKNVKLLLRKSNPAAGKILRLAPAPEIEDDWLPKDPNPAKRWRKIRAEITAAIESGYGSRAGHTINVETRQRHFPPRSDLPPASGRVARRGWRIGPPRVGPIWPEWCSDDTRTVQPAAAPSRVLDPDPRPAVRVAEHIKRPLRANAPASPPHTFCGVAPRPSEHSEWPSRYQRLEAPYDRLIAAT